MSKKFIVGHLGRDVKEVDGKNGKFLSFPVAYEGYDKEAKKAVTRWVDVTMNTYGAGLIAKLGKGAAVAILGNSGEREYTKDGQTMKAETLSVDNLSIGASMFATYKDGDTTMAAAVGRLGKDAKVVEYNDKSFVGFSLAAEMYNKEAKANETVWLDATVNRYGAGLPAALTKGTQLAVSGIYVPAAGDKGAKLLVNSLAFFGNKKKEDPATPAEQGAGVIGANADDSSFNDDDIPF